MEMVFASERRVGRRSVLVACQVVRESSFTLVGDIAVDLSPEGMLLLSDAPVSIGEELIVSLRVPGTNRWIDTTATVARVVRDRRRGDMGRAVGLRLAIDDGETGRLVRGALRRFPPPLPRRPMRVDYAATAAMIALS